MPTAADLIAKRLYDAGCRFAFGIPGGEVLAMMDALTRAGIRFVLAKHENCAGFMAEGTHHATGAPGILLATVGPGVANAFNVVANAQQDRVPLIFLTGRTDPAEALTYTHQVFDHAAALAPVVKATFTAADGGIEPMIDKAIAIATDDPPGPVHIDVPIAVWAAEQRARTYPKRARPSPAAPAPGPDLDRARAMLAGARRPVLIAGQEVLHHDAAAGLAAFARQFQIPVLTTYKAKGVLPEGDPLSLGGHGLSPLADKHVMPFLAQADFVLCAGYDPIEMRIGWRDPWDPAKAIELSAIANRHYLHHAAISFVGHVGAGLRALGEGVRPGDVWRDEPAALRATLRRVFGDRPDWGPNAAFAAARRAAPADTVVTVDTGAHRILVSQMWECDRPRAMLQSTGLCTMGCGVPLAAGYKLARGDRPVIAFVGDGGLEMVLGELATLRDLKLPVVIVVLVDASLALIELKQRGSQLANVGVDFGATDFPAVAQAMGGHGVRVRDAGAMEREVKSALARDRFTVIAAEIGRRAYDGAF